MLEQRGAKGDFGFGFHGDHLIDWVGVNIGLECSMLVHSWLLAFDDIDAQWDETHIRDKVDK